MPSSQASSTTPLQRVALNKFLESPSPQAWSDLVGVCDRRKKRKRHRKRRKHRSTTASAEVLPAVIEIDVEDDPSNNDMSLPAVIDNEMDAVVRAVKGEITKNGTPSVSTSAAQILAELNDEEERKKTRKVTDLSAVIRTLVTADGAPLAPRSPFQLKHFQRLDAIIEGKKAQKVVDKLVNDEVSVKDSPTQANEEWVRDEAPVQNSHILRPWWKRSYFVCDAGNRGAFFRCRRGIGQLA